jgi:anti-anti-sigma factor
MAIRIEHVGDVAIVIPEGVLTGDAETDELENNLKELIRRGQKKILLNLTRTTFMTSHAFGVLIATHASAKKLNIAFYICGMQERVMKVIKVIRVMGWPKQFDSCEEALKALQET